MDTWLVINQKKWKKIDEGSKENKTERNVISLFRTFFNLFYYLLGEQFQYWMVGRADRTKGAGRETRYTGAVRNIQRLYK